MPAQALNVLLPTGLGRTLRTVAQSRPSRNFLIVLGTIAGCVINGESLTAILRQGTWFVAVTTVLVLARTGEALVRRRKGSSDRPPGDLNR